MENLNEAGEFYMMISAVGLYFLIPLEQVERVSSMADAAQIQVWDFRDLVEPDSPHTRKQEVLILHGEDEGFGLVIDEAVEMCRIRSQERIPLDSLALCKENSYLDGVVHMSGMDPPLVYLVDTQRLSCLLQECDQ